MLTRRFVLVLILPALLVGAEIDQERETRRASEWKVPEIFEALALRPGATVADIGAGDGFLAVRLAKAVGPEGRVLAVDINEKALGKLTERAGKAGFANIKTIHSQDADPLLKPDSLDAAVVLRSYHEFTQYREMLDKIRAALRPGARLVIADVGPEAWNRAGSRDSQCAQHVLASAIVEKELAAAGFKLLSRSDPFAKLHDGETAWLLAAQRP